MSTSSKIAVIGAGAAGLVTLQVLSNSTVKQHQLVAFGQSHQVGGVWNYSADPQCGPMYDLHTNLPKEVMAIPGFPFDEQLPSFLHHSQVLHYLQQYCKYYDLERFIKFNSEVMDIKPAIKGNNNWNLSWKDNNGSHSDTFDSIVVCNGHYESPYSHKINGSESFNGSITHSRTYRGSSKFSGRRVALLGGASSAQDIALEISQVASEVYICYSGYERFKLANITYELPPNLRIVANIARLEKNSMVLEDKSGPIEIDDLILCTGYLYYFPFLNNDTITISTSEGYVPKLYKQVVHSDWPNLFFIGLCTLVAPFPLFYYQIWMVKAILENYWQLPEPTKLQQLIQDEHDNLKATGSLPRHSHRLSDKQWEYSRELHSMSQSDCLPVLPVVEKLYAYVSQTRSTNLPNYKKSSFKILNNDEFQVL